MAAVKKKPTGKVVSIQAERKARGQDRGHMTRGAWLQGQTLAAAHRHGLGWEDDEVERLVAGIEKGETAYELAMTLGRTYYSMQTVRGHVAFALRHERAIWGRRLKR